MGETVVITGSTRGIGFGLACRFLERECNVVLNGSSPATIHKAMARNLSATVSVLWAFRLTSAQLRAFYASV